MKINQKNCIGDIIGITGMCEDAKIYIDSLPGINIVTASDIVSDIDIRPETLVSKSFALAKKIVEKDLTGLINKDYKFNKVIDETEMSIEGSEEWKGLENVYAGFKVFKNTYNKYLLSIDGFEIISDREIEKTFFVKIDGVVTEQSFELVKGRNRIDIALDLKSDFEVYWSMSDFKIGNRKNYYINKLNYCRPCDKVGYCHYVEFIGYDSFGISLTVKCIYDSCNILAENIDELENSLLFMTGIQYLVYALSSDRVNAYTRNSREKIQFLLLEWQGGRDEATGITYKSQYWSSLMSAYQTIKRSFTKDTNVFQTERSVVLNSLP